MPASLTSRVAWLVPAFLIVEACASGDRPTAPRPGPEFAISDGVHEGGTPGFYFLPPVVAQPTFSGSFDADITTLNPQIAICDITNGPDNNCGGAGGSSAVIVFTTTSTPAITVDLTTSQYQVKWDTRAAGFVAGHTYRVHVTARAWRRAWRRRAGRRRSSRRVRQPVRRWWRLRARASRRRRR